ncbi:hypothetical protein AMJ87_10535 [candidate division WOR_3 bacterium SM23_60]|uniref:Outer membrane protein beta-barrel domain-containing protein n=1 Tax=candidate division WOR_3 bacterium SM23_60 TaxID=1703780 RepID=A0A0S8G8H4_UNCW3|nr:MAG: hypothetical protein AMJ87_10535 [candidate division WOR_3 bacterium SM23_60]
MITNRKYNVFICLVVLVIVACGPRKILSPHTQHEMIAPYIMQGTSYEFGGSFTFNDWTVGGREEHTYIRTYPAKSFSLFLNMSDGEGTFSGGGGMEFIGAPLSMTDNALSGFALYMRPYLSFQLGSSIATGRLAISPLIFGLMLGEDEWIEGNELTKFIFYQLTLLLHNPQPSRHVFSGGFRFAPRSVGILLGFEGAMADNVFLRSEMSYVTPRLFAPSNPDEEVRGEVYNLTFGMFWRGR